MDARRRAGLVLVLVGVVFLFARLGEVPAWPLVVIVPGLVLLGFALFGPARHAGLAVPGSIVTMVGLILGLQEATGTYQTWSYAWGLVLAAVGIGTFLQASIETRPASQREGLRLAGVGLALFAGFGVFFEAFVFGNAFRGIGGWLVPVALIAAGAWMLLRRSAR